MCVTEMQLLYIMYMLCTKTKVHIGFQSLLTRIYAMEYENKTKKNQTIKQNKKK